MTVVGGYLHMKKCGGMSWKALARRHSNLLSLDLWRPGPRNRPWRNAAAIEAKGRTVYFELDAAVAEGLFLFTFVRNPWDRFVSAWMMFSQNPRRRDQRWECFGDFVELACGPRARREKAGATKAPAASLTSLQAHTRPQVEVLRRWERRLGRPVDFVGRYERYAEDSRRVLDRLSIEEALPRRNRRPRPHYAQFYDAATRGMVARYCAETIERFGYRFEGQDAPAPAAEAGPP